MQDDLRKYKVKRMINGKKFKNCTQRKPLTHSRYLSRMGQYGFFAKRLCTMYSIS